MKIERDLPTDLQLRAIADQITAPAFVIRPDMRIVHLNARMCDHVSARHLFSAQISLEDLVAPDARPDLRSAIRNQTAALQVPMARCDDTLTIAPMVGPSTEKFAYLAILSATQETASPDVSRWQAILANLDYGVWDYHAATQTRFRSTGWRTMRGLDPDDSSRDSHTDWLRHVHPDDQSVMDQLNMELVSGRRHDFDITYRDKHTDGNWRWIRTSGKVVASAADGTALHIVASNRDVTSSHNQLEEFDNLSKSLELAVTTAGIGVWQFNLNTMVTKWDAQMLHIYGLDPDRPEDVQGAWERQLHPEDFEATTQEAERCLRTGDEFVQEYRIIRPDKTVRYIRSRAAQFTDNAGVKRVIGVNWDITEDRKRADVLKQSNMLAQAQNKALETARAKMEHNAQHDALTGLANRRKLDDVENQIQSRCAVLHIDLDRFKQINDTLGHAAGDQVIVHAANILRNAVPDQALVARIGGDEFVIILPDIPPDDQLMALASRIIDNAAKPVLVNDHECRFGMSIGIATTQFGETGEALFANADIALYLAKKEGGGCYRFYTEDLKTAMQARNKLADDILRGLQNDEFFCLYQPQFDARTLDLSGVEALVRWRHPDGQVRAPDSFLPVAEELNVVSRIDQMVLEKAIADTRVWQRARLPVPRMSVNVSARRLIDPSLPESLECLKAAPGEFAFELLESVFLDAHDDQLAANLACIRELGIDIEVDDFGTGHASIVGLLRLQPNRLKIDRELVGPVDTSDKQRMLVKSIVEIGKLQGIGVVAEGVETPAHIDVLRDLGCDHLQGYGLARPMPRDQLTALLRAAHSNGKYRPHDQPSPRI